MLPALPLREGSLARDQTKFRRTAALSCWDRQARSNTGRETGGTICMSYTDFDREILSDKRGRASAIAAGVGH